MSQARLMRHLRGSSSSLFLQLDGGTKLNSDLFFEKLSTDLEDPNSTKQQNLELDETTGRIHDQSGILENMLKEVNPEGGFDSLLEKFDFQNFAKGIDKSKIPDFVNNGDILKRLAEDPESVKMDDKDLHEFFDNLGFPRNPEDSPLDGTTTEKLTPGEPDIPSKVYPGEPPVKYEPDSPVDSKHLQRLKNQLIEFAKLSQDGEKMALLGEKLHQNELKRAEEDPISAYDLGVEYFVFKNYEKARLFLSKAAEADHPKALYYMAKIFCMDGDFESAKNSLLRSARLGDSGSCFDIALAIYKSILLARESGSQEFDNSKHVNLMNTLLLLSAEKGNTDAMVSLGFIYYKLWRIESSFGDQFDWENYDPANPTIPTDSYLFTGDFETEGESKNDIRFPIKFHKFLLNPPLPDPSEPLLSLALSEFTDISLQITDIEQLTDIPKSTIPDLLNNSNDSTTSYQHPTADQLDAIRKAAWGFFENAAQLGNPSGYFGLGYMTLNGNGEPYNISTGSTGVTTTENDDTQSSATIARNFFREASLLEFPSGTAYYAGLQWYGIGGPEDKQAALRLFRNSGEWIGDQMIKLGSGIY